MGWYFVVQITRQAGKNEISAFLQHYLLLYGWYFGVPVSGVKFAPVYKPQIQASMDRLEGAPTLDSGGLAGSVITSGQAKVDGQPCKYSKSDGYKFHIGPPRDSNKWAFLSINPTANVASQTAYTLLEGDESQDIDADKWERDAQPMGSFNNATTVLWGVAWTKDSFIYRGELMAHDMEDRLEKELGYRPKLVFKIDAYAVIASGKGDGEGGSGSSIDETELSNLKTKAAKVDDLTAQCKKLLIENAVLKEAGKYNPVNPAQVVRAISADYLDSIEFDEENGTADAKSIARAIRKVHDAEPNLFKPAGDDGDDDNGAGGSGNGFRGKGPGGAGSTKNGELEAKKAEALEMLGIKKDDKK